jgi:cytochrome c biogenesis protein CcmG/thiol:disulfide interchange protein DsbE
VPVISGYDFVGQPVRIDPVMNGPTLIVASAHWCIHCDIEIEALLSWQRSGEIPQTLNIVGVSSSLEPAGPNFPPDEWLAARGWPWPVLADSRDEDARLALGIMAYPNLILVDEHGLVRWRAVGTTDARSIDAAVDQVIAP